MKTKFDYQGAKDAGYSDEEIMSHLSEMHPKFDFKAAQESGYSPEEINEHLASYKPKKSKTAKAGRVTTQYGLGLAENALLPYELATVSLASKPAQQAAYRENVGEDIERLLEQKSTGVWDEKDQELLDNLSEQMKNPEKSDKFVQTADIGVRGLAEKATGLDLHPEGVLEKAASWTGFIKDPTKIAQLAKSGSKVKDIIKAISPETKESLRGLGAGSALEIAEQGEFGPIGTMAAAIVGDLAGGGVAGAIKAASKPKETLAKVASTFTPKQKLQIQKDLIEDFRKSGIQADVGTLTDSNLMKMAQSRLAQSGLTGHALDDLRTQMTNEIKKEYAALADSLGQAKFATTHEAGEVARNGMKQIRDADLAATRSLYENAKNSLNEKSFVAPHKLAKVIENLEKELRPGSIKSKEQQAVLDSLETLKRDIYDSSGKLMFTDVKNLINNKIALNDIINYEVQGGAKQLLKSVVGELDRAIISHGKQNPGFAKSYIQANKRFANHAKTFRSPAVDRLLRTEDASQIMGKMNSVQGIKNIENILSRTPQGKEIFNNMKRLKLDQMIGDHLVDSTTQQVKLGTFSKLLEKGKNREIAKELLGNQNIKRLELLQKNVGKLAETAQKFFNASKSGVVVEDIAVVAKTLKDFAHLFSGNPWPLARTTGGILGARYISRLMADGEFLKMVEEAIKASGQNNTPLLMQVGEQMIEPIKAAMLMEKSNQ